MTPPSRALFLPAALVLFASIAHGQTEAAQDMPSLAAASDDAATISLSLEDALRIGVGNDLGLRQQEIVAESAGYDAVGSWGDFDPVLTANVSYVDAENQAANADFLGVDSITDETYNIGTGILFPLTTGGSFELTFDLSNTATNNPFVQDPDFKRTTTDVIAAQFVQPLLRNAGHKVATSRQREFDLEFQKQIEVLRRTRQDLVSSIENAYWDLVAAIAQYEVAIETLELGNTQLRQNVRRLDAGVGTEVDVMQAEATVAQRKEERLLRETEVQRAADALKAVLYPGTRADIWDTVLDPTTPLPDPGSVVVGRLPPWTNALVVALESRAELREQRLEIERSEQGLIRSASERRPGLDLTLRSSSRGFSPSDSEALEIAAGWDFPTHTAALSFSYPIGNRARSNAERRARAQLRGARLAYDQLESQIVAEVRDAVRQVEYSRAAVDAALESERLGKRQLEAEQARYREGLSTNFQVLEFQQQLASAKFSATSAKANLAKALTALERAQGVLGEIER